MNFIYNNSPVLLQNILVSAYGYYWRRRRFGGVFKNQLKLFRERNTFSHEEWEHYQTIELRKLLCHAYETVPFYKERYSKEGFTLRDFKSFKLSDLDKLPFLEKEDLRKYGKTKLLSNNRANGQFYSSSGSTGTPTSIFYSYKFHQTWSAAFEVRIREWAGVDRFTPRGMIGGRKIVKDSNSKPPYYRYNYFENQTYFSAYHIGPNTVYNYLNGIIDGKVEYMTGYAMSNFLLAKEFQKARIKPPKMKAVITSSEKLTSEMRKTLEDVYECKVFDSYSGVEACGLISETNQGQLLNSQDVGIIEVLNSQDKKGQHSVCGELVSTGLLNFDQPLIRYRIGDRVCLKNECFSRAKYQMPVINSIDGRIEDVIVGPNGQKMVRFHSVFVDIDGLVLSQIIQETNNYLRIKLVIDDGFNITQAQSIITSRIKSQLGDELKVSFEYVSELPLTASGKIKAVISKI